MNKHDSKATTQERTVKARGSRKLIRISGNLSLEKLKALQDKQPPRTDRPIHLALRELHVAPCVFQWRLENEDIAADERHVIDLVWVLENANLSKALDPIVVYPIGERFFVLDGHHRLDAYHTAAWKSPVPVEHFPGRTLKEAQAAALAANAKNRLPMSKDSKHEAAWRMVVQGWKDKAWWRTRSEIHNLTGASRSTLTRMRAYLADYGEDVADLAYKEVLQKLRDEHMEKMDGEAKDKWKEEKARKLADYLLKGPNLIQDPEITARALQMVSSHLPQLLVDQWPEETRTNILTRLQEEASGKAPALVEAIEEALGSFDDL